MKRLFFSGLPLRWALLVLVALLPDSGLVLYTAGRNRQRATENWLRQGEHLAADVLHFESEVADETRPLLITLAHQAAAPGVSPDYRGLLAALRDAHPRYLNIGLINPEGLLTQSARPTQGRVSLAGQPFFRTALTQRVFACDGSVANTVANKPSICFGYPVTETGGKVKGVLFAAIDPNWLDQAELRAEAPLFPDASLIRLDSGGGILARYPPESDQGTGSWTPDRVLTESALVNGQRLVEVSGEDGSQRVLVITPVDSPLPGRSGYVVADLPRAVVFGEVDRTQTVSLLVLGIFTVLAVSAAWLAGNLFVLRQARELAEAIRRVAAGDLGARSRLDAWSGELRELAQSFNQMGEALERREKERRQAEEELRRQTGRLQALSRRLVEVQEEERRHLARELHDEIGQLLTALHFTLDAAMRLSPPPAQEKLREGVGLIEELMAQTRELSADLRPSLLDTIGLLPALRESFDRYTRRTGVRVRFQYAGLDRAFPPKVGITAYRVVQEALTNVARHARVTEADVLVEANLESMLIRVEDRGTGFHPSAARVGRTAGLPGMEERVAGLGGRLVVRSAPGRGTQIEAVLPLTNGPEEAASQADESGCPS